jgi:hypothetical protein
MSHQEPPVYRAAYDLTIAVCRYVKDCQEQYKGTIGLLMQSETMAMELALYHINDEGDKLKNIQTALDSCYAIRLAARLLLDLGVMKLETSISLNMKIEEVARQLCGWKRSLAGGVL